MYRQRSKTWSWKTCRDGRPKRHNILLAHTLRRRSGVQCLPRLGQSLGSMFLQTNICDYKNYATGAVDYCRLHCSLVHICGDCILARMHSYRGCVDSIHQRKVHQLLAILLWLGGLEYSSRYRFIGDSGPISLALAHGLVSQSSTLNYVPVGLWVGASSGAGSSAY